MELDPIVLLAYISVSINIITLIAAVAAYAIFRVRKRRRQVMPRDSQDSSADFEPVFLKPYQPAASGGKLAGVEAGNSDDVGR